MQQATCPYCGKSGSIRSTRVVATGGEAFIKSRCAECWQQWKVSDGMERRKATSGLAFPDLPIVPDDNPLLPLKCPECAYPHAYAAVRSQTILTVKCGYCRHTWSMLIATLPEAVLHELPAE